MLPKRVGGHLLGPADIAQHVSLDAARPGPLREHRRPHASLTFGALDGYAELRCPSGMADHLDESTFASLNGGTPGPGSTLPRQQPTGQPIPTPAPVAATS